MCLQLWSRLPVAVVAAEAREAGATQSQHDSLAPARDSEEQ